MIKFCSRIAMTGSAAAALLLSLPAAAQDEDIVEAAAPKGKVEAEAVVEEENEVTLDIDSWHSLQCMVILYLTIDDAENKLPEQSNEGLYLNIGYHLGQFTARTPDISPADLIKAAIDETFADKDAYEQTAEMCKAAAGSIADQTAAISAQLNQPAEDQESAEDGEAPR